MTITSFPPGTSTFFEVDESGEYTGTYVTVGPTGETLPEPEPPTYADPPAPDTSTPPPAGAPGSRSFDVVVKEGFRAQAGDLETYSTGKIYPTLIVGWSGNGNAVISNDRYATTTAPAGDYCTALEASGFVFSIPEGATITGIKVTVERSKV